MRKATERRIVTTVGALTLLLALPALAAGTERRTISVSGHAEVAAAPDRAVLAVAVETEGDEAGSVVTENAERSAKVVAALKQMAGKDAKITTSGYAVHPRYSNAKPGEAHEPKIAGYTARNEVVVETAKIDAVGKLIDAAVASGANRISSLRFELAQRAPYLRAALEQAGKEAQAQAESIAEALGVRLKGVLSASSDGSRPPIPFQRAEAFGLARDMAASTPIESGDVTVSASVQVTYEIE